MAEEVGAGDLRGGLVDFAGREAAAGCEGVGGSCDVLGCGGRGGRCGGRYAAGYCAGHCVYRDGFGVAESSVSSCAGSDRMRLGQVSLGLG